MIADFILNSKLLDDQRLAKQRVEAKQILDIIQNQNNNKIGWKNHPIVHAWRNFPDALKYYSNCIILEFIRRGGNNNLPLYTIPSFILMPWWVSWDRLHQSHRAMLIRKNPFYYMNKFIVDPEYNLYGYIWPNKITYENRLDPLHLITSPIPDELINPIYCNGILKSGPRSGQKCNRLVKDKHEFCKIHRKH